MDTHADEIQRAIDSIGLSPERFRRLPADEARRVYESAQRRFVPRGQARWWWEYFPTCTSVHFPGADAFRHLSALVPDADSRVWFIADDFRPPHYSVWEASVREIQAILGECYAFEYYLIEPQFRWLLCENHHSVVIAVGREIEDKLSFMSKSATAGSRSPAS